jgi:hypothetical protein
VELWKSGSTPDLPAFVVRKTPVPRVEKNRFLHSREKFTKPAQTVHMPPLCKLRKTIRDGAV